MPDTGFKAPTTTVSSVSVTTPDNQWVSDDAYGVYDAVNDEAVYDGFGNFAIPAGATINGIEVQLEGKYTGVGVNRTIGVRLWNNGSSTYSSAINKDMAATTDSNHTYGGATNLWGKTWIVSDFDDVTFKVKTICNGFSVTSVEVDFFQAKVYYTEAGAVTNTGWIQPGGWQ